MISQELIRRRSPSPGVERERALAQFARLRQVALLLGHDPEVVGQRGLARLVAEPLADREALQVPRSRVPWVAALRAQRPRDLEDVGDPGLVTDRGERLARPTEQRRRVVEAPDPPGEIRERVVAARDVPRSPMRDRQTRASVTTASARGMSPMTCSTWPSFNDPADPLVPSSSGISRSK